MRSALATSVGVVLAWWTVLMGCASRRGDTAAPRIAVQAADVIPDERLGVDDVFLVRIIGEPEMSGEYRVAVDGTIDFPYTGRITIAGLAPGDVQRLLTEKLKEGYLRNPQITLMVKEWNSRKVTILGQVSKPGAVAYFPKMTVMDAIAAAGGLTPLAATNSVSLHREVNGRVERTILRVGEISDGKSPNSPVLPGDLLFVEERLF